MKEELKEGDIVYYDREVYNGFIDILYDRKHIISKIEEDGSIWTKGYGWNYRDYYYNCPNELITSKLKGIGNIPYTAIKRVTPKLDDPKTWCYNNIKHNFV